MCTLLSNKLSLTTLHAQAPVPYDYVLPGLPLAEVGALIAPGGTGKSIFALQICYALASMDTSFLDQSLPQSAVAYLSFEDQATTLHNRLYHISKTMPWAAQAAEKDVHVFDLSLHPMDLLNDLEAINNITNMLKELKCRLCFIDTLSGAHQGDENSNTDMAKLISNFRRISQQANCALVFLHHSNKTSALLQNTHLPQASRGASALTDNVRWQGYLAPMSEEEATAFKINANHRTQYVKFGLSKLNYAKQITDLWFTRNAEGVLLPAKIVPPQPKRQS
jgi:hypothetical protein